MFESYVRGAIQSAMSRAGLDFACASISASTISAECSLYRVTISRGGALICAAESVVIYGEPLPPRITRVAVCGAVSDASAISSAARGCTDQSGAIRIPIEQLVIKDSSVISPIAKISIAELCADAISSRLGATVRARGSLIDRPFSLDAEVSTADGVRVTRSTGEWCGFDISAAGRVRPAFDISLGARGKRIDELETLIPGVSLSLAGAISASARVVIAYDRLSIKDISVSLPDIDAASIKSIGPGS